MTEVEPQIYAYGSTIVATFQQGRTAPPGGGASGIGFATSTDSGLTWQDGSLPGVTTWSGGDRYDAATDPSVVYNAAYGLWLIESLPVIQLPHGPYEIFVSRSGDGLQWDNPITVFTGPTSSLYDKPWITCDNWPSSPYFGNCYIQWDDASDLDRILMSTSTDGGATWATPLMSEDRAVGLGGQPLVQPSGRVVVPYLASPSTEVRAFISDDGGRSWSTSVVVSTHSSRPPSFVRDPDVPSAAIDGDGTIYMVWADCRFRASCVVNNDVVVTTSADGLNWSPVTRIPIDDLSSPADHFLAGIGANQNSFAPNVGLAIVYYYFPTTQCSFFTCQLSAGFITSLDGGLSWSDPIDLAGPMSVDWLARASGGKMVGDYFSVFYTDDGVAHPVFAAAGSPSPDRTLFESMFSTCVECSSPAPSHPRFAREIEPVAESRPPAAAESSAGALRISAAVDRVNIGAQLPLIASGAAVRNSTVHWTVEEGEAGGSVSSSGIYRAPALPGAYHVVASSGSERARLEINVFTVR